jgi:hypothetical protein
MNALKKQADSLWSLVIKKRDNYRCQLAGKDHLKCKGNLQSAHIISRTKLSIRYNLCNGRCLCQAHHTYYTFRSSEWIQIVTQLWNDDYVSLLQQRNLLQKQFDFNEQIDELRMKLETV